MRRIGIFWDFENCCTPGRMSGYSVAGNIRRAAATLGDEISTFKAYVDVHLESSSKTIQQSELQASGVTLVHCPHAYRKEVADRILLVDLMVFALECKEPSSVVLITGDRDFTYAVSVLRMKGHRVFVVFPSGTSAHSGLKHLANGVLSWQTVLQSDGSALEFEEFLSSDGTSPIDSIAPHISQRPGPQPSVSSMLLQLDTLTKPSQEVIPTPFSQLKSSDTATYECGVPFPSRIGHSNAVATAVASEYQGTNSWSNLDTTQLNWPLVATMRTTGADSHGIPPASNASYSSVHLGIASLYSSIGDSDRAIEIDAQSSHVVTRAPSSSSGTLVSSKAGQGTELSSICVENIKINKDAFAVLVDVLLEERANGRASTSCDALDGLLRHVKPALYQDLGVCGLREYLELARNANVIFLSDIFWENRQGWVSLRRPEGYHGGDVLRASQPYQCKPKQTNPSKAARRRSLKKTTTPGTNASVDKRDAVQSRRSQSNRAGFFQLIEILRRFSKGGKKRVRCLELSEWLQNSGDSRLSRAEVKTYLDMARASGIIHGGEHAKDFVELNSELY